MAWLSEWWTCWSADSRSMSILLRAQPRGPLAGLAARLLAWLRGFCCYRLALLEYPGGAAVTVVEAVGRGCSYRERGDGSVVLVKELGGRRLEVTITPPGAPPGP